MMAKSPGYSWFSFPKMLRWCHSHTNLNDVIFSKYDWLVLAVGESIFSTDVQTADVIPDFPAEGLTHELVWNRGIPKSPGYSWFSFPKMFRWGHSQPNLNAVFFNRQDWLAVEVGDSIFCKDQDECHMKKWYRLAGAGICWGWVLPILGFPFKDY